MIVFEAAPSRGTPPPPAAPDVVGERSLVLGPPAADVEAPAALMGASMAASTVTAYARDWKGWVAYADAHGLDALPADPAHVCAFLAAYAVERSATTTQWAAMAIGKAHRLAGLPSPVDHEHVRRTLAGLRRTKGMALRQALPLCTDDVARLVAAKPADLRGIRDRPSYSSASSAPSGSASSSPSTSKTSTPVRKGSWPTSAGRRPTRKAAGASSRSRSPPNGPSCAQ